VTRRRTFGTARQLASGRWQARYTDGGGRRVTLGETFPSQKAAWRALAKTETDLERGTHVDPSLERGTVGAFWQGYRTTKTDWSPTTRQNRESVWRLHVGPVFDALSFRQVTQSNVRSWHATLHKDRPATAQSAYRLLRQVFQAAVDDNRIVSNPCRVRGAGQDRSPERRIASLAEVEAIVEAMPERMRLLPLLATYAGLRRSELLGLRRRDLDVVHRMVSVNRSLHHLRDGRVVTQAPKTPAGRRTVSFGTSIAHDVSEHLARFVDADADALVFTGEKGGPLRPHVLGHAFRKARALAGRDDLSFHDLRHTSDTLTAAQGATLPELMHRMGHATPHSALRYLHATRDRDRVLGDALAELRPSAPVIDLGEFGHGKGTESRAASQDPHRLQR
jgi:integrase